MTFSKKLIVFIFLGFAIFSPALVAQVTADDKTSSETEKSDQIKQDDKLVRIITSNGSLIEGKVIEISICCFVVDVPILGMTSVEKQNISAITYLEESQMTGSSLMNKRSTNINPQATRYFFAPSAKSLKKGDRYYHNLFLFYNSVSFGVTDGFTSGLSMSPLGAAATLKVGGEMDGISWSAGNIVFYPFNILLRDDAGALNIAFVNTTFETDRKNVSVTFGMAFSENSGSSEILNLSGMFDLSNKLWVITENYFILTDKPVSLFSAGVRKASANRNVLMDLGIVVLVGYGSSGYGSAFPLPVVGVTVPF